MDPSTVRIICGLIAVALLALIVMRRRSRAQQED
jgi:MYXO-CTERM domain-containing protein